MDNLAKKTTVNEEPVTLSCEGDQLLGIVHHPAADSVADGACDIGIVVIVGGAQYRIGSHRLFVSLARFMAEKGVTTLRFDRRGMGDSEGEDPGFDDCDDDIRVAVQTLRDRAPHLKKIFLLGLCDGATAGVNYRYTDPDVAGYLLINPWIRSAATEAEAFMGHYYKKRFTDRDFWRDLLRGNINVFDSIAGYFKHWRNRQTDGLIFPSLETEMYYKLLKVQKPTLFLVSQKDITGQEFCATAEKENWQALLQSDNIAVRYFDNADHTFSVSGSQQQLFETCISWLRPDD